MQQIDENLNYNNIHDKNLEKAIEMYNNEYTHNELISMLCSDDDVQKQISALLIEKIENKHEAQILVANLVGQEGKIREAVSFKLKEFCACKVSKQHFYTKKNYDIFLKAIIDINGNVCRNVINSLCYLKPNAEFVEYFCSNLIIMTDSIIKVVNEFDFQEGKYKVNKEVFKLYWCLETIFEFCEYIDIACLKNIVLKTYCINEYTIREKTAKILTKIECDSELTKVKLALKNDPNYYVSRY